LADTYVRLIKSVGVLLSHGLQAYFCCNIRHLIIFIHQYIVDVEKKLLKT